MSILDRILDGIFVRPHTPKADAAKPTAAPAPTAAPTAAAPASTPAVAGIGEKASFQPVDIEPILDERAKAADQKLNWRTSIVDLMKLLDLDFSLDNRKDLAKELGYTGDTGDSAAMNIWLHQQVMQRVAQNGGKVPANLAD